MSKPSPLDSLAAEVAPLLAGGAAHADPERLRRPTNALRALAKQIPALAPLADAAEAGCSASAEDRARSLLNLLVRLRSAQFGLATAGVEGPFARLPRGAEWETTAPAADVYPAAAVLRNGGWFLRPCPTDLRLVPWILDGIGSDNAGRAAAAARAFRPLAGRLLGELVAALDLNGGTADAGRLGVICQNDSARGLRLCRKALRAGSEAVRAEALKRLAELAPDEVGKIALRITSQVGCIELRLQALQYLSEKMPERVEEVAVRWLAEPDDRLATAAATMVKQSSSDAALEGLLGVVAGYWRTGPMQSGFGYAPFAARRALSGLPHPRATERLLAELRRCTEEAPADGPGPPLPPQLSHRLGLAGSLVEALAGRPDGARGAALFRELATRDFGPIVFAKALRQKAIAALGQAGGGDADAVPALVALLADSDAEIRCSALRGLGALGRGAATALPAVATFFERPGRGEGLREAALETFGRLGAVAPEAVLPVLRSTLAEGRTGLRRAALRGLLLLGPAALPELPAVRAALRAQPLPEPDLGAIAKLDPDGSAVPALVALLDAADPELRTEALDGLNEYGKRAAAAVPAVTALLNDPVESVRRCAAHALGRIRTKT